MKKVLLFAFLVLALIGAGLTIEATKVDAAKVKPGQTIDATASSSTSTTIFDKARSEPMDEDGNPISYCGPGKSESNSWGWFTVGPWSYRLYHCTTVWTGFHYLFYDRCSGCTNYAMWTVQLENPPDPNNGSWQWAWCDANVC